MASKRRRNGNVNEYLLRELSISFWPEKMLCLSLSDGKVSSKNFTNSTRARAKNKA